MKIAIPVSDDNQIEGRFCRTQHMVVATVDDTGEITDWQVHKVSWDELHDVSSHDDHHARIASFLRDNGADHVVVHHIGPPMVVTLSDINVGIAVADSSNPREAVFNAWKKLSF